MIGAFASSGNRNTKHAIKKIYFIALAYCPVTRYVSNNIHTEKHRYIDIYVGCRSVISSKYIL